MLQLFEFERTIIDHMIPRDPGHALASATLFIAGVHPPRNDKHR
jgi:hypothetical protein